MHLRWLQGIGSAFFSAIILYANQALAQITPDSTLPNNSQVNTVGNTTNITGGTQAGTNLFHSFQEFSVLNGRTAYFNNAPAIQNIISRVTGGSISNINGLIQANGAANLFLLNPNGIVFGENARLDIGGSLIASTANRIKFADGTELSANSEPTSPLLTISVPIGLQFGTNPGAIAVKGIGHTNNYQSDIIERISADERGLLLDANNPGLQVREGKTLALVGGNVSLDGGILKSPAGRVEIGSVGSNSSISLNQVSTGWQLGYDRANTNFADIQIANKSWISTTGVGGGEIALNGKNIRFNSESILRTDTIGNRNGGGITIVGDSIEINNSNLGSYTFSLGNGGAIRLEAKTIKFENNGGVFTETQSSELGAGKAGDIAFKADSIVIQNQGVAESNSFGSGNGGQININANSLKLEDRVRFRADAFAAGNSGDITIKVGELIVRKGAIGTVVKNAGNTGKINITADSLELTSAGIISNTQENSTGNAGGIILNIANLMTLNNASIIAKSDGTGNGGNININAKRLDITLAEVSTNTTNTGKAGEIDIDVRDSLTFKQSAIINTSNATGNSGKISIQANSFNIQGGGINNSTEINSTGNAGEINITITDLFSLEDGGIYTRTLGTGSGGIININAGNFQIKNAGIVSEVQSTGESGKIQIKVKELFDIQKVAIKTGASGTVTGGIIEISAGNLQMESSAIISESESTKKGGDINIKVKDLLLIQESSNNPTSVNASTLANGNAGEINILAHKILLNGLVSISSNVGATSTPIVQIEFNDNNIPIITLVPRLATINKNAEGNGGNIRIDTNSVDVTNGAQLTTSNFGKGNAGNININTNNFSLSNGAKLVVSNLGQQNAGNVIINAKNRFLIDGIIGKESSTGVFAESQTGNGGNITLTGDLLVLRRGGLISTISRVEGEGGIDGNVDIKTQFLVAVPQENSDIIAIGSGRSPGSNIQVRSQGIFGTQIRQEQTAESDIVATGEVRLNLLNLDPNNGLINFPIELVDAANLINKNFCAVKGKSSFIITGRGGLPPAPNDAFDSYAVWEDWQLTAVPRVAQHQNQPAVVVDSKHNHEIVEAQGWVIDDKGMVTLVAAAPTVTPHGLINAASGCEYEK